jgi:predicted AAA+ superfamily ATPase
MALTNADRVGKALLLLRDGLSPFVEQEMLRLPQGGGLPIIERFTAGDRNLAGTGPGQWDVYALMKFMWEEWNEVFKRTLGQTERSLVSELRGYRDRWAHQKGISGDDAYRAMDSAERLLAAVNATQADEVARMKQELMRLRYDEQVRSEARRQAGAAIETTVLGVLPPWREVVTPHRDVASGRYSQAEFAADLHQVHIGGAGDEYQDPVEFFRRTYLTESLRALLVGAVRRLAGDGGDPVVQLQTNFGGGKTHSMLALYHLFSGSAPASLPGIDEVLAEAGVEALPAVRRVVIVGNKLSPGRAERKPDGTEVKTLWGEIAWQLGGRAAYEQLRADDENATSPGDMLRKLFEAHGPCLVLIDEWVAYARQLHEDRTLPGGTFETHFSFAQVLTESAKLAPHCLLVVSLPASDTPTSPHADVDDAEVGGIMGRTALARLRHVIGRLESSWRPATSEEGFEIVRRRLFEPMGDAEQFKKRDVVARGFADFYRAARQEFPPECADADYEKRMKSSYPIHPEVFDRLYSDWSTLLKFQRTRGVLRLMAKVIHDLWEKGDRSPLIMPGTISIDDAQVQSELTRYLPENWVPVIAKDVDGAQSLPVRIDHEVPNLGKHTACRRVARAIYLGSAPPDGGGASGH